MDRFLDGSLSPGEFPSYEQHLNDCKSCQSRIEDAVAGAEWWKTTAELLAPDEFDNRVALDAADSDAQAVDEFSQAIASDGLRRVLELLAPCDAPNTLGQLDDYQVVEPIGCGGMAIVLKGFEPKLRRHVAIKVLAPHLASSTSARSRFSREARAAAAIHHPNVIAIHRVAEMETLPYLVMPYIAGGSLQDHLDTVGPLDTVATIRVGKQIAAGLAAAHELGIVHRDIKPANILLDSKFERIVITDFGLARAADDASITQTGILAGTPHYMSPEQARGETVDHRSDLFSLGSLLFTANTGTLPFAAENSYGVLRKITDHPALPLSAENTAAPAWLVRLTTRLHQSDVSRRYQSAQQVENLLSQCLAALQNPKEAIPPSLQTHSLNRRLWGLIGAITLMGLVGFGYWQSGYNDEHRKPLEVTERSPRPPTPVVWPEDGEWVTLTARFVMRGALPDRPIEQPSRDKQIYSGPIIDESLIVNPTNSGLANVFVWLSRNDGKPWPRRSNANLNEVTPFVVRYESGRLQPHVGLLQVGQTLQIVNRDPIQHFVDVGSGERLQIPSASSVEHVYRRTRHHPHKICCEYHPWFGSYVLVADHSLMATSDGDGNVRIDNIPSGNWTIHLWHELVGHIERVVDERGLVQVWPAGKRDITLDQPEIHLGELLPSIEPLPQ